MSQYDWKIEKIVESDVKPNETNTAATDLLKYVFDSSRQNRLTVNVNRVLGRIFKRNVWPYFLRKKCVRMSSAAIMNGV